VTWTYPREPRVLFVHAHPDDETLQTGATMAACAARGARVTLVTCTLGEQGEVVADDLAALAGDGAALGAHRLAELTAAMAALGVVDHVRLGGDHHYRDSGMVWAADGTATAPPDLAPDAFWAADLREAADHLVVLVRARRPHVLVTYDPAGGYLHPDHVQAHRVATYAAALAGVPTHRPDLGPAWAVPRTLWIAMPASHVRAAVEGWDGRPADLFVDGLVTDPDAPMLATDADIAVAVDARDQVARTLAALAAYHSQLRPGSGYLGLPTERSREFWGREFYRFAGGVPLPGGRPADDLFAGLA